MLIDFLQHFLNLILGLFLLRFLQLKLEDRNSQASKAIGYLIH